MPPLRQSGGPPAAHLNDAASPENLVLSDRICTALQLINFYQDLAQDHDENGRIYLPQDELARFGVSEDDILARRPSAGLHALLHFQAVRARGYYDKALAQLPPVDRYRQRSGLIMAAIYLSTLDAIERQDYPVLQRRVRLAPWRKLWIAWRTARGEARREQRRR